MVKERERESTFYISDWGSQERETREHLRLKLEECVSTQYVCGRECTERERESADEKPDMVDSFCFSFSAVPCWTS